MSPYDWLTDHRYVALSVLAVIVCLGVLVAMGRPWICPCGDVKLWDGAVVEEDSQHVFDWWSFSHVVKGMVVFVVLRWLFPSWSVQLALFVAVLFEGAWEVVENAPFVVDWIRAGLNESEYLGDTVVNSAADMLCFVAGFAYAHRVPRWASWLTVVAVEVFTLVAVRVSLFFTVFVFLSPAESLQAWQVAAW